MNRLLAALIITLLPVPLVMAAVPSSWQMCMEQSPNFSQLPKVDEELGPIITLPERMAEIAKVLRTRMEKFEMWRPFWEQITPEERQLVKAMDRRRMLLANCQTWLVLRQVSDIARRLTAWWEAWQLYLQERQIYNQVQLFSAPERLAQQAIALRQKSEQFDPTQSYSGQMSAAEMVFFEDLKREVPLVEEFARGLEERK
jgi:hypothetical protein